MEIGVSKVEEERSSLLSLREMTEIGQGVPGSNRRTVVLCVRALF